MRRRDAESGQTIVLFAVALLLLGLITFFTISVGNRIQEKVKAQAAADTAAYGLAISQARAMNVMAMTNRAIVAEYVSALSVAGHISWMDIYEWTFDMQAELWQKLKADKNAECAQYQYCHSSAGAHDRGCHNPVVCCRSHDSGCCDPCDKYDCWAAACSVPDSLFDTISNDWYQGWGPTSFKGIHSRWHDPPHAAILELGRYAADYVKEAKRARDQGREALSRYHELVADDAYTRGVARTVDPRMTSDNVAPANVKNVEMAVETFPKWGEHYEIRDADWDVFNEILTGTRGGGKYSTGGMTWETQHGVGDGYFTDVDAPRLPGICAEGQYHHGWARYYCNAVWDQNDDSDLAPAGYKGGEMMLQGNATNASAIHTANTGNAHQYTHGTLGGRDALSAVDRATTTASFSVEQIACPGDTSGNLGLWNQKSLVCLSETGKREELFSEVAPEGDMVCMRSYVQREAGDTANYAKGYNVADDGYTYGTNATCNANRTEVGFFRFNVPRAKRNDDTAFYDLYGRHKSAALRLYNQPYAYAATELDATRDENGRKLPWDFTLRKSHGSALELDNADRHAAAHLNVHADTASNRDGTDVAGKGYDSRAFPKVRGFAAGLSYYHNPGSWHEVPNLWNPYWRATLAAPGSYAKTALQDLAAGDDDVKVGGELGITQDLDIREADLHPDGAVTR